MRHELIKKIVESEDFRWTFFENFRNGEQETVLARAKYEKRFVLDKKRKRLYTEHFNKLNQYVKFLTRMIKDLKKPLPNE